MVKRNLILAFESSCDETSVSVIEDGHRVLSNIVATQIASHQRFGGVVPEVASRHHIEQITKCTKEALEQAGVSYQDLTAVAVTYGPGLVGSLLIGVTAAKTIAWAHQLPLVPVNHMAGHLYAARFVSDFTYPMLGLLVSGGHTELVYMKEEHDYQIIGETRDDAAGEAYDKVGRVMGINYPPGKPSISGQPRGMTPSTFRGRWKKRITLISPFLALNRPLSTRFITPTNGAKFWINMTWRRVSSRVSLTS